MNDKTIVVAYVTFGLFLNSVLHTWYVAETNRPVRFALPYSGFGAGLSPIYGYAGAILLLITATWVLGLFFAGFPDLKITELEDLVTSISTGIVICIVLLFLSQFIAGASWSKFALDGLVLLTSALILMSYVRDYSFLEIIGTYISLLALIITLGTVWLTQYVDQFELPNFPSATYFGLSSLYVLFVSLSIILRRLA